MHLRTVMSKKMSLLIAALLIPALTWGYAKPVRLLLPQFNDVECSGSVCVENPDKMGKAIELYTYSFEALNGAQIHINEKPTFVFCSTIECYHSFGGGDEKAKSYPFLGTVIGPESWQRHITQHELVHWFQFSELGAVETMLKPEWFREGMAYVFSGAPASDIPKYYWPMIDRYKEWHSDKTWSEAILHSESL